MQKQNRLGPNRQFQYVYRRGKRASCREMSLLYVKGSQKRVGFSVSKKIGVAVVRNRVKRRLRECVRPLLPNMKNGLYVFVTRPGIEQCTFEQLQESTRRLIKKLETQNKPAGNAEKRK